MNPDPPEPVDGEAQPDDPDLGAPVRELRAITLPLSPRFGERVRGRIERRLLAGQLLDVVWVAPLAMLLEFLRWPFELLAGRRSR